jgi:hypothetical protein
MSFDEVRRPRAGEPREREFHVGPDVVLQLHANGRFAGYRAPKGRRPRQTQPIRVAGTGEPVQGAVEIGGGRIRYWLDAGGRVAAVQVV